MKDIDTLSQRQELQLRRAQIQEAEILEGLVGKRVVADISTENGPLGATLETYGTNFIKFRDVRVPRYHHGVFKTPKMFAEFMDRSPLEDEQEEGRPSGVLRTYPSLVVNKSAVREIYAMEEQE